MSFFDIRFSKSENAAWSSIDPPDLSIGSIITDFRWHKRLYSIDKLPFLTRFKFHILRVFQLASYSIGWYLAQFHERQTPKS